MFEGGEEYMEGQRLLQRPLGVLPAICDEVFGQEEREACDFEADGAKHVEARDGLCCENCHCGGHAT